MCWRILYVLGCCLPVWGQDDKIVGKGKWLVEALGLCPEPEQYPVQLEVMRRKVNRTHDMFVINIDLPEELTETNYGVYIETCKKVDGGCKLQYAHDDVSLCKLAKQYAKENFIKALTIAGLDNPDCPIPKGKLEITDFVFDYQELPEDGMTGEFTATAYITKGYERHMCVMLDIKFSPVDSAEDDQ